MSEFVEKSFFSYKQNKYPMSYSPQNIDFALNYKPLDSDIFLVTYPKCGTSWTQQILYLILNDGNPINDKNFVNNTILEYKGIDCMRTPVIKTHLSFNLLPFNESTKYFYVIRNPKDTTVSYYNHLNMRFNYDFHYFFKHFITGQIPYGDYFDHLLSFWSHRMHPNICLLVYEQMKANTRDSVLKIGRFLGQEYENKLIENNELVLNKVLKYSSIEFMKNDLKDNSFIVRNGTVGQWKEYFNSEENRLITNKFNSFFKETQLYTIWREIME